MVDLVAAVVAELLIQKEMEIHLQYLHLKVNQEVMQLLHQQVLKILVAVVVEQP
tara:strand:- start:294 stop:455 length:162 start_codon:yes stop_codon:yes gene_type:complete